MDNHILNLILNLELKRDDFLKDGGRSISTHMPPHELLRKLRTSYHSIQYTQVDKVLKSEEAALYFNSWAEMSVTIVKTSLDPTDKLNRKMWACISLNRRFWTF